MEICLFLQTVTVIAKNICKFLPGELTLYINTTNVSKLIEKYFLEKHILKSRKCYKKSSQDKEIYPGKKNVLVPLIRKFNGNLRNGLKIRNI